MKHIDTKRLYNLELLFPAEYFLHIKELRKLGETIWENESGNMRMFPEIVVATVSTSGQETFSICYRVGNKPAKIILAKNHLTNSVLIHEITHALGYWDHSPKFIKRYFDLLVKYAEFDYNFLLLAAYSVNMDLEKLK
jgi:hypothetical protein